MVNHTGSVRDPIPGAHDANGHSHSRSGPAVAQAGGVLRHSGSSRDPLPPGGYAGREGPSAYVLGLVIVAVVSALAGAVVVSAGGPAHVTAQLASLFSSHG